MQLDNIIVICLAVLFFGGIIYLALKDRKSEGNQNIEPETPPQSEAPDPPQIPNEARAGRKRRKRRNR